MDRLSGSTALATILIIGGLANLQFLLSERNLLALIVLIVAFIYTSCVLIFNKSIANKASFLFLPIIKILESFKIRKYVENLYDSLRNFKGQKDTLIIVYTISLVFHLISIFIFMPLILCLTIIPNSLHGIGLQEGLAYFFFIKVGAGIENILMFSFLIHIIIFIVYMFGGIIYIFNKTKRITMQEI